MNAPCRDCENKGCGSYHDHCPAFKKFREERNCVNERREQKSEIVDAVSNNIGRMKRTKNKHKVIKSHKK